MRGLVSRPWILALAVPTGALLGLLVATGAFLPSAPPGTLGPAVGVATLTGGLVAVVAGSGAVLAVLVRRRDPRRRSAAAMAGAAAAVTISAAVLGVVSMAVAADWSGTFLWVVAAAALGVGSAAVAAPFVLLTRPQRR